MPLTMGQAGGRRQVPLKSLFRPSISPARPPWLIIINTLRLPKEERSPSFIGAVCDPCPRFWRSSSFSPPRRHRLTAAFSLSPTRRTVTASTSASPKATAAALLPRAPIANHGILPRPRPIAASIPTRSRARFPRPPAAVRAAIATNTSPSPANADALDCGCGEFRHTAAAETTRRGRTSRLWHVGRCRDISRPPVIG